MESDESGSTQNSSRRSSSSNYEEENEEFTAATDSIDHLGDCSGWEPYCDEPMADTNWIAAYQARKQAESDKYTEFKQRLENKLPIENWCVICHFCFPIVVCASSWAARALSSIIELLINSFHFSN